MTSLPSSKKNWNNVIQAGIHGDDIALYPDQIPDDLVNFYESTLKCDFPREDYKKVIQLVLIYLGKLDVKDTTIQRPGAMHKARWMCKIIYSLKVILLNKYVIAHLAQGAVFTSDQLDKLQRFVKFCIEVYLPWWYKADEVADAPKNDFVLVKNIRKFS